MFTLARRYLRRVDVLSLALCLLCSGISVVVLLVVLFGFDALAFIILWYILVSVIGDTVPAKGR